MLRLMLSLVVGILIGAAATSFALSRSSSAESATVACAERLLAAALSARPGWIDDDALLAQIERRCRRWHGLSIQAGPASAEQGRPKPR
jgi:hypothetical protein